MHEEHTNVISDLTEERNSLKQQLFEYEDRMIAVQDAEERIAGLEQKVMDQEDMIDSLKLQIENLKNSTQPNEKFEELQLELRNAYTEIG